MAKRCSDCGNELGLLQLCSGRELCRECAKRLILQIRTTAKEIAGSKSYTSEQVDYLIHRRKKYSKELFTILFNRLTSSKSPDVQAKLESEELSLLKKLSEELNLSNEDISYKKRILPLILERAIIEIANTKELKTEYADIFKLCEKARLLSAYLRVYNYLVQDKELDSKEIEALVKLQESMGLSKQDIDFNSRVLPHIYVNSIRRKGGLPIISTNGFDNLILKRGEVVHFGTNAILQEPRRVSLGYSGGSQGISFKIAKGVYYRVGAHRGHVMSETRMVETSRGNLLITNQRIYLYPFQGQSPLSIPLNKVSSYSCYENGLELYKEGRQKCYFFTIDSSSAVEILGLCLGHLLMS